MGDVPGRGGEVGQDRSGVGAEVGDEAVPPVGGQRLAGAAGDVAHDVAVLAQQRDPVVEAPIDERFEAVTGAWEEAFGGGVA